MENTQNKSKLTKKQLQQSALNDMLRKIEEKVGGKIIHVSHKQNYKNENGK